MENASFDVFIIGGGINGVGIAADAASRGLSVMLCEKGDLSCGTSSASSKLIHGGLRYLENYDFLLVRKALQEREILLRIAPHLVTPLEFVLPHNPRLRPMWLMRMGLFIYDHLASHPLMPNSKKIQLANDTRGAPLKNANEGFSYYDCFDDDARLVITNAMSARDHGAQIVTHTSFLSATLEKAKWHIELFDHRLNQKYFVHATFLVNASGPWIDETQHKIFPENMNLSIELIQGSHIVIPKLYDGDFAYILQNSDERVIFVIPYYDDFTLIGTTDIRLTHNLNSVTISHDEKNYLCESVNQYFKKNIKPEDIVWSYSGVRCLQKDNNIKASKISRDYKYILSETHPLLTVISGKITTYRYLSAEIVDKLKRFFPHLKKSQTATKPLPGGNIGKSDFQTFVEDMKLKYLWLPPKLLRRYVKTYGANINVLLDGVHSIADLGEDFSAGLYEQEVKYLMKHEWAKTAEDILWRRTKLGLIFTDKTTQQLSNSVDFFHQN